MMDVNQIPPDRMTPEQRRLEVAVLLARGIARCRQPNLQRFATSHAESEFELANSLRRSVHMVSNNQRDKEPK